jgi:hypothetical protein
MMTTFAADVFHHCPKMEPSTVGNWSARGGPNHPKPTEQTSPSIILAGQTAAGQLVTVCSMQGVTKRCRLSLLSNSTLVIRVQMRGEGGSCGVSANEYSCAHHVTWSPNKLWRSTSIFNLWL